MKTLWISLRFVKLLPVLLLYTFNAAIQGISDCILGLCYWYLLLTNEHDLAEHLLRKYLTKGK